MNHTTSNISWPKLRRPIRVLAPMEDVTDTVFRRIVAEAGRPDVFFTEFTAASSIFDAGAERAQWRLRYTPVEQPLVAQIWGNSPADYAKAARWLSRRGFAGVDINMGCPKPKITRRGYCGALIKDVELAKSLVRAAQDGADSVPVSLKTRTGFEKPITEDWIGALLELKPDAITVHGRTVAAMSEQPCNWDEIEYAVRLRDRISPETAIIGNGDVATLAELHERASEYGVDGVMVGRGIFGNLFLFSGMQFHERPAHERVQWMKHHFQLFRREWGTCRNYHELKKFVSVYVGGFPGADILSDTVLKSAAYPDGLAAIEEFLSKRY